MPALGSIPANALFPQSIQMGRTLISTDANAAATITFPQAFAATPVVVCASSNTDASYTFILGTRPPTATDFTVDVRYLPGGSPHVSALDYINWVACAANSTLGAVGADQMHQYPMEGTSIVVTNDAAGASSITFPTAYATAPVAVPTVGDSTAGAVVVVGTNTTTPTAFPTYMRNPSGGGPVASTSIRTNWLAASTPDNLGDIGANNLFFTQMQASRDYVTTDANGKGTLTFPAAFASAPTVIAMQSNSAAPPFGIYIINLATPATTTAISFYARLHDGTVAANASMYVSWIGWV